MRFLRGLKALLKVVVAIAHIIVQIAASFEGSFSH